MSIADRADPRSDTASAASAAFTVERHGIDHIPEGERHGRVRHLALLWSGCVLNVAVVTYGALLTAMGLSLWQAVLAILVGNLTWLITGLGSLPGPAAGVTAFITSRAAYGRDGNRIPAFFNWISNVGYEVVGLALAVLAADVLIDKAGITVGTPVKIVVLLLLATAQSVLPIFGHAAITRALRLLAIPFLLLFALLAVLTAQKVHFTDGHAGSWPLFFIGVALSASSSGLGWTGNAADYSRYLPSDVNRRRLVLAVVLGGGIPQILLMTLGAAVGTVVATAGDPISGLPTAFADWFLVPYLLMVVVQMLAVNAVDLYSSGVSLQALGLRIGRWQAVAVDAVLSTAITALVVFNDAFDSYLNDFLLFTIVWLAPWAGAYVTDYLMRRGRYDIAALTEGRSRFRPAGIIALATGGAASLLCLDTTVFTGPIADAAGSADFSVPAGLLTAGLTYFLLARRSIAAD
ncbi:cytosine permease [Streptomyces sp. NPDC047081]|uniref:purine-cytosine permease family protein n=1 Tax=Streptomyces sp. NPDC047081 TaxID=3154706 RepID=UPI0033E9642F